MFSENQLLPISALQHLMFCRRQAALIHVERLWAENRLTVEGRVLHRKTHDATALPRTRASVRTARSLPLASFRLGLHGVADVVEFSVDQTSSIPPFPIEYKRGRPKKHDADRVQLCAQALCIEEMLRPDWPPGWIPSGAIYYGQTRRRMDVPFDTTMRTQTEAAAVDLHELIDSGITPVARREKKCDRCSLLHLCLPDALRPRKTPAAYIAGAVAAATAAEPPDID